MLVGDTPVRADVLGVKRTGGTTKLQCPQCYCPQDELGSPHYDCRKHRRTRAVLDASRETLQALHHDPQQQQQRSTELGVRVQPPDTVTDMDSLEWDTHQVPPESMHQDSRVSACTHAKQCK